MTTSRNASPSLPLNILLFGVLLTLMGCHHKTRDFDKSVWKNDLDNRFEMADAIVNSKILIKKDTSEINQLLGHPTESSDSIWTYDMGMGGHGLGFMFHYLVLNIDTSGKVSQIRYLKVKD